MLLIGQHTLLDRVTLLKLPQFLILIGPEGQGKKIITKAIAESFGLPLINMTSNINGVRECIENTISMEEEQMFAFYDIDTMSLAAKNSLLKITEEPPKNLHIVITACNESNVLPTLISRGQVYHLDKYTTKELKEYAKECNFNLSDELLEMVDNPKDINILKNLDYKEFYNYVNLVFDNIFKARLGNCLKIGNKIAYKDDDEGYPIKLFFKMFIKICKDEFINNPNDTIMNLGIYTNEALGELCNPSLNKHMIFDNWLIRVKVNNWIDIVKECI